MRHVALLYSVVLPGGRRLAMAELRRLALDLGLGTPRTLAATGNLVFEATGNGDAAGCRVLEAVIEPAFEQRFGKAVPVIVRGAGDWRQLVAGNPFDAAAAAAPASVAVRVMRMPLGPAALTALEPYRAGDERMAVVDGDLWVHFAHGAGGSKLLAAITPRRFGVGTFRNWNTLRGVGALLEAPTD